MYTYIWMYIYVNKVCINDEQQISQSCPPAKLHRQSLSVHTFQEHIHTYVLLPLQAASELSEARSSLGTWLLCPFWYSDSGEGKRKIRRERERERPCGHHCTILRLGVVSPEREREREREKERESEGVISHVVSSLFSTHVLSRNASPHFVS